MFSSVLKLPSEGLVYSSRRDHCHGCTSDISHFFVIISQNVGQSWCIAVKRMLLRMSVLHPAVMNTGHLTDLKNEWLTISKATHSMYLRETVCTLSHLHQCLYCFNPIQYYAKVLFTTMHSLHSTCLMDHYSKDIMKKIQKMKMSWRRR